MQFAFHNGTELAPFNPEIPFIGNRGLFYGDGLFETIKLVKGKPLFLEDHILRLANGCRLLGLKLPDTDKIENLICNTVVTNSRLRLSVWRDSDGYYLPDSDQTSWLLTFSRMNDESSLYQPEEVNLAVYSENLKPSGWLSNIKTLNGLLYVSSARFAKLKGVDEAVILNSAGRIAESTSSNLFALIGSKWVTPPLSESCLDGVMRKNLLQIMQKNGVDAAEAQITPAELFSAEEVLLTNVIRGVRQVVSIDDRKFQSHSAKHFTQLLNAELKLSY